MEANQAAGDKDIHAVGFSRGAALALSFANEIAHKYPMLKVGFVGLFDVVGQFGLPGREINAGHNLGRPPTAARICHAMALDESRLFFPLTRLSRQGVNDPQLSEVWFRGVHSDVGGSGAREVPPRGLASIPLNWMFVQAQAAGLQFDEQYVAANKALAHATAQMLENFDPIETAFRRLRDGDVVHESVTARDGCNNPTATCMVVSDLGESRGTFGAPLA